MIRVNTNDTNLDLRDEPTNWGEGVWLYNGQLFTGIMYEYFPSTTQLSSEAEFKEGILDGRQVEYWPNGKINVEYFKKFGSVYSSFKEWDDQGVLLMHKEYDNFGHFIRRVV